MQKFLSFKVLVDVLPTKNESGVGVWRATSLMLKMHADGETPDKAIANLENGLRDAENAAVQVKKEVSKQPVTASKKEISKKNVGKGKRDAEKEAGEDGAEKPSSSDDLDFFEE